MVSLTKVVLNRTFSQLTASTQFSSLGLVLLSALARASSLLGVTSALHAQGKKVIRHELNDGVAGNIARFASGHQIDEDQGELVERDAVEKASVRVSLNNENDRRRASGPRLSNTYRQRGCDITLDMSSEACSINSQRDLADAPQANACKRDTSDTALAEMAQPVKEGDAIDKLFDGLI